ncbi:rhodanese-related sulfurtransferase [Flavobacteriaceae bacterium]|nr:rhodanese-related sulfurtransferase [Flavobacteriaceae bacterium]MDB9849392.1 rhodanese-related sulfurtransferase [Flavobacteriaceae bacterium]MDB9994526.1 rhodanese-related sulfurtransferase [Flavobacteriaceae bacterium]
MQLYNKLSAIERSSLIEKAGKRRITLSFYKYHQIKNTSLFRDHLYLMWERLDVLGRIYIASEGINAQLSVPSQNFKAFKTKLDTVEFLKEIRLNVAVEQDNFSFLKLKVKIRKNIVADGLSENSFDLSNNGIHVNASEFNSLIDDPNTLLVDMRNHYESEIGHFEGAILPDVDSFRESLPIIEKKFEKHKKSKNIVMYCTGGIRCEKASAFLKHKGYEKVYQLNGGIIEYARQVDQHKINNKFIGKNFVFDHRRSETVSEKIIANCHQCGKKCDTHINCENEACHLLFIQCEKCAKEYNNCCSEECYNVNSLSIEDQKKLRKGKKNSNQIFKKGRSEVLKFKKTSS